MVKAKCGCALYLFQFARDILDSVLISMSAKECRQYLIDDDVRMEL